MAVCQHPDALAAEADSHSGGSRARSPMLNVAVATHFASRVLMASSALPVSSSQSRSGVHQNLREALVCSPSGRR